MLSLFIHWNPDPVALSLGVVDVRWYSLCWVAALLCGYAVVQRLYRHQHIGDEKFEPLFLYCFIGILVGARLGHCLFYEPGYFLSHPLEMILPMRQTAEGWKFTGYEGLASHGGTLGLMIALYLYNRKYQVGLWNILDNIAIATPIAACFIRIGNLVNSEIVGHPTAMAWGFVFEKLIDPSTNKAENFARHPGQLYEAIVYFILFFVGLWIYHRSTQTQKLQNSKSQNLKYSNTPQVGTGWFFGWCIFSIFVARILIEYTKEVQEAFEQNMLFNMGQLLSVPFVLLGAYCMWNALKHTKTQKLKD